MLDSLNTTFAPKPGAKKEDHSDKFEKNLQDRRSSILGKNNKFQSKFRNG